MYKLKRFIKDPDDLEGVKDILEEHYTELINMFKFSCCFEIGEEPFDIQINGVVEFNNMLLQIPNVELDTIFIATNFTSKKEKNNPERALVRHNWLEFISRMALTPPFHLSLLKLALEEVHRCPRPVICSESPTWLGVVPNTKYTRKVEVFYSKAEIFCNGCCTFHTRSSLILIHPKNCKGWTSRCRRAMLVF